MDAGSTELRLSCSRPWRKSWRLIQHCTYLESASESACSCTRVSPQSRTSIRRTTLSYSQIRSSGLSMTLMCTESRSTRLLRVTWPQSQSTALYSSSTRSQANYSSRLSIPAFGLARSDLGSWLSGKQLKKWQHSSDACPSRSSRSRLSWLARACLTRLNVTCSTSLTSSSRAASFNCHSRLAWRSRNSETASWRPLSRKCCSSTSTTTGKRVSRASLASAGSFWFCEPYICIRKERKSSWHQTSPLWHSLIIFGQHWLTNSGFTLKLNLKT